jgi:(1->4)-alpha-D-glucan 1-alpha-D-glucosylmutase
VKLLDKSSDEFLASFGAFASRTALLGALNGLSQLALKALLPGVPDFYQGTERWDFSLVDPDNRRPVDFDAPARDIASNEEWSSLAAHWPDGRIKLILTRRLLALRHAHAELFRSGKYEPLTVTGAQGNHVIAFARTRGRERLLVAIGRHFAPLTDSGRKWPGAIDAVLPLEGKFETALGSCDAGDPLDFSHIPVRVLRQR